MSLVCARKVIKYKMGSIEITVPDHRFDMEECASEERKLNAAKAKKKKTKIKNEMK